MKSFCITTPGLEDVSVKEIEELLNLKTNSKIKLKEERNKDIDKKSKTQKNISKKEIQKENTFTIEKGIVFFDASPLELCTLTYGGQSFLRVLSFLQRIEFTSLPELVQKIEIDFSFLKEKTENKEEIDNKEKKGSVERIEKTFVVRAERIGIHPFSSQDIEKTVGEYIAKTGAKVLLEKPTYTIFVHVNDTVAYIGIDYCGIDISKREYKVFPHIMSLKGTIAYSLVSLADFSRKKTFLDPFCGSGTIVIEAALFAKQLSPRFYKKEFAFLQFMDFDFEKIDKKMRDESFSIFGTDYSAPSVKAAEKNAKIAGVHTAIKCSRTEVEWVDTKFDKNSIDCIVTNPPALTKLADKKAVEKAYRDLFYGANFSLKKNGTILILTRNPDAFTACSKEFNFIITHTRTIQIGSEELTILLFHRQEQSSDDKKKKVIET